MASLLLNALKGVPSHRPPIWLMRQAGRYMPEYRRLKERYSFLELCRNPELALEITLLPIRSFEPDAAILFADILLILETLGFELRFGKDQGPLVETHDLLNDVYKLQKREVKEVLAYIHGSITLLKQALHVPLLGFCGAPFTLATYVLEGRTSKDFKKTKEWMYYKSKELHHLLNLLTDQTIDYLNLQIEAGVDAVQIFDSWAGYFSYRDWKLFSYPYLKKIIQALKPSGIPTILFAKGSCALIDELIELEPAALSLDASADLLKIAKRVPSHIALQGNLDPTFLEAPLDQIEEEARRLCYGMKDRPGYIFNLGHGILPSTPEKAVERLIKTIQGINFT